MGINIPRKKLFFQWGCCRQGCRSRGPGGGSLPPLPRFWQISSPYLNQVWQIMPTTLLIASPRFSDLPMALASRYVPDFRLLRIIACPFQSIPSNDTHAYQCGQNWNRVKNLYKTSRKYCKIGQIQPFYTQLSKLFDFTFLYIASRITSRLMISLGYLLFDPALLM